MKNADIIERRIASRLWEAERKAEPVEPFANEISTGGVEAAYRVQRINVARGVQAERLFRGRKIGLTSHVVQQQLGVGEPDYGTLFDDMEIANGGALDMSGLIAPRIEAEIALFLREDVTEAGIDVGFLGTHVETAASALEIVDSRLKDWRIGILDTISDNGASARYVLSEARVPLADIDLKGCAMELRRNGTVVSTGTGAETLGHPLQALAWLADVLISHGRPLRAGDVVLTGALGPVVPVTPGDLFQATFDALSPVTLQVVP